MQLGRKKITVRECTHEACTKLEMVETKIMRNSKVDVSIVNEETFPRMGYGLISFPSKIMNQKAVISSSILIPHY